MSKLIGIVGGMGPKAGENLHAKILLNTRAVSDSDHLQVLLYTNPAIPDRNAFLRGEVEENPAYEILRSLQLLYGSGARVLCVPCNTAHAPAIWEVVEAGMPERARDAELLNIVSLTVGHLVRTFPSVSHVGILATTGTIAAGVYQTALSHHNVRPVVPKETTQRNVQEAVFHPEWGVKAQSSPVSQIAVDALRAAAVRMIADGAEAVILGCTEIPLALTEADLKGFPLIDATAVLAREAIRRAAGEDKLISRRR
ncbi:amino acid racemase [bacterium]|nr:amino acid racemase [bacterium]